MASIAQWHQVCIKLSTKPSICQVMHVHLVSVSIYAAPGATPTSGQENAISCLFPPLGAHVTLGIVAIIAMHVKWLNAKQP